MLSTGMANFSEICAAAEAALEAPNIVLLKCTSSYPTEPSKANILSMLGLRAVLEDRCEIGLSDHTKGYLAPVLATTLGAILIEKHITLDGSGLDGGFALKPDEFKQMVEKVKETQTLLGEYSMRPNEDKSLRRSLYYARAMKKGEKPTEKDFTTRRPSLGIAPAHKETLVGSPLAEDVEELQPVDFKHFGG